MIVTLAPRTAGVEAGPRGRARAHGATTRTRVPARLATRVLPVLLLCTLSVHAQGGLLGLYFDDVALTELVDERVDPTIDFTDWTPAAPPGTQVEADGAFGERWLGSVLVETAGTWTFEVVSNDGVRLWIDDVQLVEQWVQQPATVSTATMTLPAGWHPIRLEHFQLGGTVTLQLSFEGPGQAETIIPSTHLRAAGAGTNDAPWVDAGPDRGVFTGQDASAPLEGTARDDGEVVAYAWSQTEGPAVALVDADEPLAQATGLLAPGTYRFTLTVADDEGATATDAMDVFVVDGTGPPGGSIDGTLRPWHRVTLNVLGAALDEASTPNPFLDRRLDVTFVHQPSQRAYRVPGFFAADGQAADSGATEGNVWRARLTPDAPGAWRYHVAFRTGPGVAVEPYGSGTPTALDGVVGEFVVEPSEPDAPGSRATGRIVDAGRPTWQHAATGEPFLKGGADSPENLLAFADFDQTTPTHAYAPHVDDWDPGDPTWGSPPRGHGLIGALDYLAGRGMNAVYFLTFNVGGDGDDVWPWTSKTERLRYDVSKLAQWEVVFEHMDDLGLMLHVVTQETEIDEGPLALDGGALGDERRLYYRELVARFGHHLGLSWNLGEETNVDTGLLLAYDEALDALDAYDHPRVVHTWPGQKTKVYGPLLDARALQGASFQNGTIDETYATTRTWRLLAADRGRPWALHLDEIGPPDVGVLPDAVDPTHETVRREALWGHMMAGGAGVEWFFGYAYPDDDLDCEDWRSRDAMWSQTRVALDFFEQHVDPWSAQPVPALVGNGARALLDDQGRLAVHLPDGGTTTLDLSQVAETTLQVRWYDPRLGGPLQVGSVDEVEAPGVVSLGLPPSATDEDWAALVEPVGDEPPVFVDADVSGALGDGVSSLQAWATVTDPDGVEDVAGVVLHVVTPAGIDIGGIAMTPVGPGAFAVTPGEMPPLPGGPLSVVLRAFDASGADAVLVQSVTLP